MSLPLIRMDMSLGAQFLVREVALRVLKGDDDARMLQDFLDRTFWVEACARAPHGELILIQLEALKVLLKLQLNLFQAKTEPAFSYLRTAGDTLHTIRVEDRLDASADMLRLLQELRDGITRRALRTCIREVDLAGKDEIGPTRLRFLREFSNEFGKELLKEAVAVDDGQPFLHPGSRLENRVMVHKWMQRAEFSVATLRQLFEDFIIEFFGLQWLAELFGNMKNGIAANSNGRHQVVSSVDKKLVSDANQSFYEESSPTIASLTVDTEEFSDESTTTEWPPSSSPWI